MEQSTLSIHCNLNEWRCNILRKYMHIKHEESRMDAQKKKTFQQSCLCHSTCHQLCHSAYCTAEQSQVLATH